MWHRGFNLRGRFELDGPDVISPVRAAAAHNQPRPMLDHFIM